MDSHQSLFSILLLFISLVNQGYCQEKDVVITAMGRFPYKNLSLPENSFQRLNHEKQFWDVCYPLNVVTEFGDQFVNHGGPLGFPAGVSANVTGVVDRNCESPEVPRDETFCLWNLETRLRYLATGQRQLEYTGERRQYCDRCTPQFPNSYKFEIWKAINSIRKDPKYNKFKSGPNKFRMGFCLTCYAYARRIAEAQNGVTPKDGEGMYIGTNYTIPTVPFPARDVPTDWKNVPGGDVRKREITLTTRITCGKQFKNRRGDTVFRIPDAAEMEDYENRMKSLSEAANAGVTDEICKAPGVACSIKQFQQQQQSMAAIGRLTTEMNEKIVSFTKTIPDIDKATGQQKVNPRTGRGEVKAVNGHHEDLMEIPLGHAHIVRAPINLNGDSVGFSEGIPGGGYVVNGRGKQGCQTMEYGMVALSPGEMETACYLTPIITRQTPSGEVMDVGASKALRAEVEEEAAEAKAKAEAENKAGMLKLQTFCNSYRRAFKENKNAPMYQHATKTCEMGYCLPMLPLLNKEEAFDITASYDGICKVADGVFPEAARFKALVARQRQAGGPPMGGPQGMGGPQMGGPQG